MLNRLFESDLRNSIDREPKRTLPSPILTGEKKEGECQIRYLGIDLNNFTKTYKKYNIEKYTVSILKKIPKQDLEGLDKINIYDDSYPKVRTGLYYPPNIISKGAQIDMYLEQSLGYMTLIRSRIGLLNQISDKIFFILFGRLFFAENLLHEIGHHKHTAILRKQYETNTNALSNVT